MDSFNWTMSYNFSSLLSLPSRLLTRIRGIDDIILINDVDILESHSIATAAMSTIASAPTPKIASMDPLMRYDMTFPGPWKFLTSGYFLSLLAMALLLNRIHHIVVPPRPSLLYRIIQGQRSIYHAVLLSIFPINLSSTKCRLIFRLPSLYLLFRSLFTLAVILLQTSGFFPSWDSYLINVVNDWVNSKDMVEVCWSTFGAVCAALAVGALTKGLEGDTSESSSPFNLFGYAFLLHMYSMPITHLHKGPPSRPDKHVLVTIIMPLLQITLIHFLGIKKSWSRQRFIPSALCSIITLVHFHAVVWTSHSTYPVLNYLPCLLESLLFAVTLLTCTLNAFTQLLLTGEIRQPLLGHRGRLIPKWEEDFPIVLLRLGTASLDATRIVGLGNEVGIVTAGSALVNKRNAVIEEGMLELSSRGVVSMIPARNGKKLARGFANEIKTVKPTTIDTDWLFDGIWYKELSRFGMTLFTAAKGTGRLMLWLLWYKWRNAINTAQKPISGENSENNLDELSLVIPSEDNSEITYRRFLLGENVSDDEEDYEPPTSSRSGTTGSESFNVSDIDDDSTDNAEATEQVALYSDLMGPSSSTTAPVLLAHMTANATPLTRRQYNKLVAGGEGRVTTPDGHHGEWSSFLAERRMIAADKETDENSIANRRICVICTVEPRDVICWPCRCLALCDDCRLNLASRYSASKHTCPCCRRTVEGYSKVFIP